MKRGERNRQSGRERKREEKQEAIGEE